MGEICPCSLAPLDGMNGSGYPSSAVGERANEVDVDERRPDSGGLSRLST